MLNLTSEQAILFRHIPEPELRRGKSCKPFENEVECGFGIETAIIGDRQDFQVLTGRVYQETFGLLNTKFIDKIVKILVQSRVDHLRNMVGRDTCLLRELSDGEFADQVRLFFPHMP